MGRGREPSYIDCVGGQGAANLGHGHPAVLAAIQQQAAELITCPELFHNPVRARYQAALCEAAGMPRVFLCNSGAEAIEGAFKIAGDQHRAQRICRRDARLPRPDAGRAQPDLGESLPRSVCAAAAPDGETRPL